MTTNEESKTKNYDQKDGKSTEGGKGFLDLEEKSLVYDECDMATKDNNEENIHQDRDLHDETVWDKDMEAVFQEAILKFPHCGRRKVIIPGENRHFGRNQLISRYLKEKTGKNRTRKQISSHLQVLDRRKNKSDSTIKLKKTKDLSKKQKFVIKNPLINHKTEVEDQQISNKNNLCIVRNSKLIEFVLQFLQLQLRLCQNQTYRKLISDFEEYQCQESSECQKALFTPETSSNDLETMREGNNKDYSSSDSEKLIIEDRSNICGFKAKKNEKLSHLSGDTLNVGCLAEFLLDLIRDSCNDQSNDDKKKLIGESLKKLMDLRDSNE